MRERERASGAERYEGNKENKEGKRNFVVGTSESERREENEREREREKASDRRIEKGRRAKDARGIRRMDFPRRGTRSDEAEF